MTAFNQLHPALQHHIVNSMGWRELRPFQEEVIPSLLSGENSVILAPTAGGKTEAAVFPVLSRMLTEDWRGLSILYVCPIKALLNNLLPRLERYCSLLGRRAAMWHGDVRASVRNRLLAEPPNLLLTTPESIEVMLVSQRVDAPVWFAGIQAVIVDEIHAFAGDDRGWHLLAVLERVTRLAGRDLQRIGLSATVGNPGELLSWLKGSSGRPGRVFRPEVVSADTTDVTLDFVGSLKNAAEVISRLHRGEKRLVFVDSRSRAEQLANELRLLDVTALVTHSSLSQEQRAQAEQTFASGDNCVIVATSVLELGIDVGDLDRVVQIDAPDTVSSFLQRMGRTGRRPGALRNCLFLATRDETLIQAAGLIELWGQGYVEPVVPPAQPYHIFAQQLMALALQERGIGRESWRGWIGSVPAFAQMPEERVREIIDWMLQTKILWDDEGLLWFGREGEASFGRKNFLDLLSVFSSPPLFCVRHGRRELGFVDESTFVIRRDGPRVLLLGGQPWHVGHIDWPRRTAYVEPATLPGRSIWRGGERSLGFQLCQSMKHVLAGDYVSERWSRRARARLEELRGEHAWLREDGTIVLQQEGGDIEWWTFAGTGAGAVLAAGLSEVLKSSVTAGSLALTIDSSSASVDQVECGISEFAAADVFEVMPSIDDRTLGGLKFSECLPGSLAVGLFQARTADHAAARFILETQARIVTSP